MSVFRGGSLPPTYTYIEGSKQMTFILHISVPVKDEKGWHGTHHWPTLLLVADTMDDAGGKVREIQKDLPKGTSVTCVAH